MEEPLLPAAEANPQRLSEAFISAPAAVETRRDKDGARALTGARLETSSSG
ncbi:hypothetical protein FQA47_024888 [Oryzias melastigma]|uniref:Uncharacterized protein n=1 Tax=Oryzias melastigma TaxID=30732 RepID=A0A834FP17_ORYME|nr:hypothetical protein FQA47_024888 [Oryzias melastigma]